MDAKNQNQMSGFFDVFLSKLKEQSFVIMLMLGVIYYQNRLMEERVAFWQKQYEEKEAYIKKTTESDKQILLNRINYLQDQRDKFVESTIEEEKTK
jgi:hypothetical protein